MPWARSHWPAVPSKSLQGRLTEARDALVAAMEHLGDVAAAIYGPRERMVR